MSSSGEDRNTLWNPDGSRVDLGQFPSFEREVKRSTFSTMTLLAPFMRDYGRQIGNSVHIQSDEQNSQWEVNVNVQNKEGEPQVKMGHRWKQFVASHYLQEGDQLTFSLTAESNFFVSITRKKEFLE